MARADNGSELSTSHVDSDFGDVLASFVANTSFTSAACRERARVLLADAVILAIASRDVSEHAAIAEIGCGTGRHRSWYSGNLLGAADAVFSNAAAIAARFQDDTEMSTWSHPGSFVVPAAVGAVAETRASMATLIDGLVAGYATTVWLGARGEVADNLKKRGFRPSPVFGPLGAAAAASRGLGLDATRTAHALNAAALVPRGSLHSVAGGGGDWRLHNPSAARDGFVLALAAKGGLRSATHSLTGANGFLKIVTGEATTPQPWYTDPAEDDILGVWHKAMPILGDNMAVALAARDLSRRFDAADVTAVRVRMNALFAAFPGTQTLPPWQSVTAAQASVRFAVAHLLVHGDLTMRDLSERREDDRTCELASQIAVVPDADLSFTDAVVEVDLRNGATHRCRTRDLDPGLFWRTPADQIRAAGELLGEPGAEAAALIIQASDAADANDVIEAALVLGKRDAHRP